MAFKFDPFVAIVSGGSMSLFGAAAWAFNVWRKRSPKSRQAVAGIFMAICGLFALLSGICGFSIMADGGLRFQ